MYVQRPVMLKLVTAAMSPIAELSTEHISSFGEPLLWWF